jgi:hypothetical protein
MFCSDVGPSGSKWILLIVYTQIHQETLTDLNVLELACNIVKQTKKGLSFS